MKNKKFAIGTAFLMAATMLLTNCTKNKTNEPLSPDYETGTSKEVSKLHWMVADIFDICMETCDRGGLSSIHNYSTGVNVIINSNTITSIPAGPPTISGKVYTIVFNNTLGKDGHLRNGTLTFDFSATTLPTVSEPRVPKWDALVAATNNTFAIDNYTMTINSMRIYNTTPFGYPMTPYTPTNTSISWNQTSDISVTKSTGTGTNIVTSTNTFKGSLDMVLLNTNNQAVPTPTAGSQTFTVNLGPAANDKPLKWEYAHISYNGTGEGVLDGIGPFTSTITEATRNMNTSPETWYKNTANYLISAEKHPFLTGKLSFKPGSKPTRDLDFGTATIVDYNAKMTIQGITYDVDCAEINE